jgi:hypothetical protein
MEVASLQIKESIIIATSSALVVLVVVLVHFRVLLLRSSYSQSCIRNCDCLACIIACTKYCNHPQLFLLLFLASKVRLNFSSSPHPGVKAVEAAAGREGGGSLSTRHAIMPLPKPEHTKQPFVTGSDISTAAIDNSSLRD